MPEFDGPDFFELPFDPEDPAQPFGGEELDMSIVRGEGSPAPEDPPTHETDLPIIASENRRPAPVDPAAAESRDPEPPDSDTLEPAAATTDSSPFRELFSYVEASSRHAGPEAADDDAPVLQPEVLEATGLGFTPDVFAPQIVVTDGQRFAEALAQVPQDDIDLRDRVTAIVKQSLDTVALTQIPPEFDEWGEALLTPSEENPLGPTNARTVGEVLSNAPQIADGLQNIDANPSVADGVRSAHTAEVEGVLPLWAVYHRWGFDIPPTDHPLEVPWTRWSTGEDWEKFHEFVGTVAAEAPPGSRFAHGMAATAIAHIQNVRDGELAPSDYPDIATPDSNQEEPVGLLIEVAPEIMALGEAFARRYDALLAEAQEKLRSLLE